MKLRHALVAAAALLGIAAGSTARATSPPDGTGAAGAPVGCESPGDGAVPSDAATGTSAVADGTAVDASAAPAAAIVGVWCVVAIGPADVADIGASIEFTADGRVQGFSGVNSFHGPYEAGDGTVEFGPVVSTRMAGPEPAADVERGLFVVLDGAQPYVLDGDVLTLGTGDAAVELHRAADDAGDAGNAGDEIVTVSGTVTYRERIALPDGAVVTVRVNDVSLADAPAVVVAEATIVPTHQVPIPYAVAVSASSFEDGHTYSLSITISSGDELLFTSTEHLAVTAEPAAQTIDVVLSSAGS